MKKSGSFEMDCRFFVGEITLRVYEWIQHKNILFRGRMIVKKE